MKAAGRRQKGCRFERTIVKKCEEHGLTARRVPLSGAMEGYKGDVILQGPRGDLTIEAKMRAGGQKQIREWLGVNDALVLGADRQQPLVVLRLTDFCDLVAESLNIPSIPGGGETDNES
jgi:hypothetical protein